MLTTLNTVTSSLFSNPIRNQRIAAIALGQVISALIAGTGICSTYLAQLGVNIPTAQSTLNYFLLLLYLGWRIHTKGRWWIWGRQSGGKHQLLTDTLTSPLASSSSSSTAAVMPRTSEDNNAGATTTTTTTTTTPTSSSSSSATTTTPSSSFTATPFNSSSYTPLAVPWWHYALLALADVEANFVIVRAYSYTSITSIMLLDCSTIPFVMLLSRRYLHVQYHKRHYYGVGLCLLGIVVLVLSDIFTPPSGSSSSGDDNSTSNSSANGDTGPSTSSILWGDFLCIIASSLYAISNVGQEKLVKTHDRFEFLGMIGLFGTCLSALQVLIFEREEIQAIFQHKQEQQQQPGGGGGGGGGEEDTPKIVGYLIGFALCLFTMYSATSKFLVSCDATLFNLSLLTSDIWAVLASWMLFGGAPSPLYFVALCFIALGLWSYNSTTTTPTTTVATTSRMTTIMTTSSSSSSSTSTTATAATTTTTSTTNVCATSLNENTRNNSANESDTAWTNTGGYGTSTSSSITLRDDPTEWK